MTNNPRHPSAAVGYTTPAEVERLRTGGTAVVQSHPSDSCTVAVRLGKDDAIGSGVKALEWIGDYANTSIGRYAICRTTDGYEVSVDGEEIAHLGYDAPRAQPSARDAARDYAQADFERRVLSCLSTHTAAGAGPVGEAVAWRWRIRGNDGWVLTDEVPVLHAPETIEVEPLYARPVDEPGEVERLRAALVKINDIRNSIIGFQNVGWSEHIYPLVAALHEAGFEGEGYEEASRKAQTLLDQRAAAEIALAETRERLEKVLAAVVKARTALAGFTSADDAAFAIDVVLDEVDDWKRRATLTGGAREGGK